MKIFFQKFLYFNIFQITFGAFTSGLDAGKIYQSWPLMNNYFFPDDLTFKDIAFSTSFKRTIIRVQFIHRKLAYIIFIYVVIMSFLFFIEERKKCINQHCIC